MQMDGRFSFAQRVRILLVGMNTSRRLALSRLMRDAGADVVTARTDEEAMSYLFSGQFRALVTDAMIERDDCGGLSERGVCVHAD